MVKLLSAPLHPFAVGVMVMVAITGVVPGLIAVNELISPFPFAANPIDVLSLVQAKVVPATPPLKITEAVDALLHKPWSGTVFVVGAGFTLIVKLLLNPGHPFAVGVTVMVPVSTVVPVLVNVNALISPFPVPDNPIDALSFVQL